MKRILFILMLLVLVVGCKSPIEADRAVETIEVNTVTQPPVQNEVEINPIKFETCNSLEVEDRSECRLTAASIEGRCSELETAELRGICDDSLLFKQMQESPDLGICSQLYNQTLKENCVNYYNQITEVS